MVIDFFIGSNNTILFLLETIADPRIYIGNLEFKTFNIIKSKYLFEEKNTQKFNEYIQKINMKKTLKRQMK